jgi:hypothetical protein
LPLRGFSQAHARKPVSDNRVAVDIERSTAQALPFEACPPHSGANALDEDAFFELMDPVPRQNSARLCNQELRAVRFFSVRCYT